MRVGVVGAGRMGQGIAQISCVAGHDTVLFDAVQGVASAAVDETDRMLQKLAAKGKLDAAESNAAKERLCHVPALSDLSQCDLVIEAVVENLAVKRKVFGELESIVQNDSVLATNTSSLSVTAIAAKLTQPERLVGLHFFNPVPLMPLVEVVPGARTSSDALQTIDAFVGSTGHEGVRVTDTPGFLVNHVGRAYVTEALRLLEERIAAPAVIDAVMREGLGFKMGPFELMDLTGLDVTHPATEAIHQGFYFDDRLRPSYIAARRLAAGQLGRKSGAGFRAQDTDEPPAAPWFGAVQVHPTVPRSVAERLKAAGIACCAERNVNPRLLIVVSEGEDPTQQVRQLGRVSAHVAVFDALLLDRPIWTVAGTILTPRSALRSLADALSHAGQPTFVCEESPGQIASRMLAVIVNLASEVAAKGIAEPAAIDAAVPKALGYPHGPLAWGDMVGPARILKILDDLNDRYLDPRYRPSPWLSRRAELNTTLRHVAA